MLARRRRRALRARSVIPGVRPGEAGAPGQRPGSLDDLELVADLALQLVLEERDGVLGDSRPVSTPWSALKRTALYLAKSGWLGMKLVSGSMSEAIASGQTLL